MDSRIVRDILHPHKRIHKIFFCRPVWKNNINLSRDVNEGVCITLRKNVFNILILSIVSISLLGLSVTIVMIKKQSKNDIVKIVYVANMWIFYEIKDITFQDVNSNGKSDVIVTAYYMVSAGENSGMPFSVATIFYQNDMEFITLPDIDKNMHEHEQNKDIEMVLKYAEEHMEDIIKEIN